jgi:hypothetical protein
MKLLAIACSVIGFVVLFGAKMYLIAGLEPYPAKLNADNLGNAVYCFGIALFFFIAYHLCASYKE